MKKEVFKKFASIDVIKEGGTKTLRDGLTYVNKAWVEKKMREEFGDDFSWRIVMFDEAGREVENGLPFQKVLNSAFVWTEVTVQDVKYRQFLPVQGDMVSPTGEVLYNEALPLSAIEANALNRAIARCFVKNVALNIGLGIAVYIGETEAAPEPTPKPVEEKGKKAAKAETGETIEAAPSVTLTLEEALATAVVSYPSLKGVRIAQLLKPRKAEFAERYRSAIRQMAENAGRPEQAAASLVWAALNDGTLKIEVPESEPTAEGGNG